MERRHLGPDAAQGSCLRLLTWVKATMSIGSASEVGTMGRVMPWPRSREACVSGRKWQPMHVPENSPRAAICVAVRLAPGKIACARATSALVNAARRVLDRVL